MQSTDLMGREVNSGRDCELFHVFVDSYPLRAENRQGYYVNQMQGGNFGRFCEFFHVLADNSNR